MRRRSVSPREQRLALVVVVTIAASITVSGIGLPLLDRAHQLEQEILESRRKLAQRSEVVSRKSTIDQTYAAYATHRTDEPDESALGRFLSELEQLARLGRLSLSLKPRPIQRDGRVSRLGVELEVEGTQETLLAFLDRLLSHPSLIELDRVRLSTTPSKEAPLQATLLATQVVVHP